MSNEKGKYFDMSEAFDEVRYESDKKKKALAATKLFGKGLFNTARYLVDEGIPGQLERMEKKKSSR